MSVTRFAQTMGFEGAVRSERFVDPRARRAFLDRRRDALMAARSYATGGVETRMSSRRGLSETGRRRPAGRRV